jgi:WD40 repeat protein
LGKGEAGIQHRDIKPQNILMFGGGVKIGDFGLARLVAGNTTGHTGSLTVAYAAPEFFNGQTARTSDQYSLAVTWCVVRAGQLPFQGAPAEMMAGHLNRPPDLSRLLEKERAVVARALAKNPAERWPGCRVFVEALGRCHVPSAIPVETAGHTEPLKPSGAAVRKGSRGWKRWLALTLLLLAAGLLAGGVWWLSSLKEIGKSWSGRGTLSSNPDSPSRSLRLDPRTFEGHSSYVTCVALSEDGRYAVSGSYDQTARLWDIAAGKEIRRFNHPGTVKCVAFSPDGAFIVAGSDNTLRVWNVKLGQELRRLTGHTSEVHCVAFSPDGQHILSGGADRTIRLWDSKTESQLHAVTNGLNVHAVVFSPDGKSALSAHSWSGGVVNEFSPMQEPMILWSLPDFRMKARYLGHTADVRSVAISSDSTRVLSGSADTTVRLWELATGKELRQFQGHEHAVSSVALSQDARYALSGSVDGTIKLWGLPTAATENDLSLPIGELRSFSVHKKEVSGVHFLPGGEFALSSSDDRTLQLFRIRRSPAALRSGTDDLPQKLTKTPESAQRVETERPGTPGIPPATRFRLPARLGVSVDEPSAAMIEQFGLDKGQGLVIKEVLADSAAAKAGLRPADVLVEFNGKPVPANRDGFAAMVQEPKANTAVDVVVIRKGKKETIKGITLP